jgi:hypothetical protein
MIVVDCQADLLEVVAATHPPGSFPSGLHGGQEQSHQHTNDCNDDKKFYQRKTVSPV